MYSIAAVDDGVDLQEGMMEAIKQAENKQGKIFSTGFPIIDAQVGGLMTGAIAVIYAQEGMGKSALALNMVLNAQKINNAKILFVNTEEKWTATCGRVLANHEVVPVTAMIRGLNKNQATKAYDFAAGYKGGAFKLISSLSEPNDIRGYVAAEKSRGNKPDIVVLDNASYIGNGSPAEQAEDVSRLALDLALNHDVAVLLVAHSPKFEKDTAPSKSLVWGGKAISKSATAMFELRKAQGDMGGKVHRIDAHITKNRNGEEGLAVPLLFRGEQMKFEER
jgi:replicative DNA helicase